MIHIQEIPIEKVHEFWNIHMQYLVEDDIISDEEDIEYFSGNEYRDVILAHMKREENKHHMVHFVREGNRNRGGAVYYVPKRRWKVLHLGLLGVSGVQRRWRGTCVL